ncbi:hypothetical protein G436_0257 [Leptospira interrogans serovar Hardjo str. Norma]|uniref:Uncharacterized protein n=1 Tax=Leptospira interrogans serovar Hardjo str. Norma TaxID=1279460 RepID=A0A0M5LE46_LEPIR|nr:hypothetical protein G436_0257 [Leptospira interrogans serovar Hardjo str. Norma]
MNLSYSSAGTTTRLRFVCKMMWELLQITILRINSKIVGTYTLRKFFLAQNSR